MVVIVSIPLVQSYFFNLSNSGKIVIEKNIEAKFLRDVKNNVIYNINTINNNIEKKFLINILYCKNLK